MRYSIKSITSEKLEADLDAVLTHAQRERIVISRRGKPCAVLVGIEDYDAEDLKLAASDEFWRIIRLRRASGASVPLAEVETRLGIARRKSTAKRNPASKAPKRS